MGQISSKEQDLRAKAYWREDKNIWQLNITISGHGRKSFYSNIPGRAGQNQVAKAAFFSLKTGEFQGLYFVKDLYEQYIAYLIKTKAATSVKQPKSFGKIRILPIVGKIRIDKFNDFHFQSIIDSAANDGLSKKTLLDIKNEFSKFWKWCRKQNLTDYTPQDIDIPSNAPTSEKHILTPNEFLILMRTDTTLHKGQLIRDPLIHLYRYYVLTGLRPGEALALQRCDFLDDFKKTIICKSLNENGILTRGKTTNAKRQIVNCALAQHELKQHFENSPSRGCEAFWGEISHEYLRDRLQLYCKANGITHITPYNFRHTFESYRQRPDEGWKLKARNNYVGHSEQINSYIHEVEGYAQLIAEELNRIFIAILEYAENKKHKCGTRCGTTKK